MSSAGGDEDGEADPGIGAQMAGFAQARDHLPEARAAALADHDALAGIELQGWVNSMRSARGPGDP